MIKDAPPLLAALIERLNYLPPDAPLPELQVWSQGGGLKIRSEEAADWPEVDRFRSRFTNPAHRWTQAARRALYEALEGTPKRFRDYIWGDAAPKRNVNLRVKASDPAVDISTLWAGTRRAVERYEDFRRLREQMTGLTRYVRGLPSWQEQFKNSKRRKPTKIQEYIKELYPPLCPPADSYPIPFLGSLRFEVDNNGVMSAKTDEFSEAITGKDNKGRPVDVRLIRECPNCQRIFWAGRIENFVCSPNCGLLLKARLMNREWVRQKREQAEKRADKELSRLGFTDAEIGAYQIKYGEHPRKPIYRYVERRFRKLDYCPQDLKVPQTITAPLCAFLVQYRFA
jgi:hypothetical protein